MNANLNIEAVTTPAERLRQAIAQHDRIVAEIESIRARAKSFAPIEAAVAAAEAELRGVLGRDAEAMQAWVEEGASGATPEPDHKAREVAARKLSEARAKLDATGSAKLKIQEDERIANDRVRQAAEAIKAAEVEVVALELGRAAEVYKLATLADIAAESHFLNTRKLLFDLDPRVASQLVGQLEKDVLRPMTIETQRDFTQRITPRSHARLAELRHGRDPADVPEVIA